MQLPHFCVWHDAYYDRLNEVLVELIITHQSHRSVRAQLRTGCWPFDPAKLIEQDFTRIGQVCQLAEACEFIRKSDVKHSMVASLLETSAKLD